MGVRYSLIFGFAIAMAVSAAAQARDFEMGGDTGFPYSIMAPERGSAPRHHGKASAKNRHVTTPHPRELTKPHPQANLSVVRGSSGSVLPTPLPRTELIPPEGGGRLTLPALPRDKARPSSRAWQIPSLICRTAQRRSRTAPRAAPSNPVSITSQAPRAANISAAACSNRLSHGTAVRADYCA